MIRALLVLLAVPAIAHAQVAKGAHVGANVNGIEEDSQNTGMGGDSLDSPFPTPGFVIGAYIRKHFTPTFSLQVEANVEQKRARQIDCSMTMTGDCAELADIGLWYLAAPVLLRFDLLPGSNKFHLHGGPDLVLSLGGGQTDLMTDAYQRLDDLVPINLGLVVGAGFEFGSGPGAITIDLRYKRWFIPIADDDGGDVVLTHQIWLASGYVFP